MLRREPPERLWMRAASFAARAHGAQRRKDGLTPYFAHPARVAVTVAVIFGCQDPVALAAALLHDTIEDTTTDFDDLESAFGPEVARCVAALTKNASMPEEERETEYDARLARADWRARLVKLADQHDNYIDARERGADAVRRARAKCLRAISLAEPDAAKHPETARGIAALKAIIGRGTR